MTSAITVEKRKHSIMNMNISLCTGCGTCAGICPQDIIEMRKYPKEGIYLPTFKSAACNECKLCLNVCPGRSIDFSKLNSFVFGKTSNDTLLGNHIGCYIGHSTNKSIQRNVSSGGLVTSLLIFALENELIDGAIVTRMRKDRPLDSEVFIARTSREIISAAGSKYCPVPVNTIIREVLTRNERFAIVGLPCHIQGIRKAETLNRKLRERLIFHLGLFCSHTVSFLGTEFLLEKMKVKNEDVVKLDYRGSGWPGGMTIKLKNGSKKFLPFFSYWNPFFGPAFFTPVRCLACSDGTNELSDISFGDAWLHELMSGHVGKSLIITRSEIGEQLLQEATLKEIVEIVRVSDNELIRAQKGMLLYKKKKLTARISALKSLGKQVPLINSKLLKSSPLDYLRVLPTCLAISIFPKQILSGQLGRIPLPILVTILNLL